mmetsp:Transcript_11365/g.20909  ORF Transcript_11365/g.20909 Transcript_11365/m.20909 type:complete len:109 (-) Transcript_11365:4-330(-)
MHDLALVRDSTTCHDLSLSGPNQVGGWYSGSWADVFASIDGQGWFQDCAPAADPLGLYWALAMPLFLISTSYGIAALMRVHSTFDAWDLFPRIAQLEPGQVQGGADCC